MNSQDILNIALAFGFLIGIGFFSYGMFELADTLRTVKQVLEDVKDTTTDITSFKEHMKLGVFSLVAKLLSTTKKSIS